jgi:signal transduction histidine kinase
VLTIAGLVADLDAVGQQLRGICNNLHPTYLGEPLSRAVEQTIAHLAEQHRGIMIEPVGEGTEYATIPDDAKTACKVVVDQAIRNAIRHGQATRIQIWLTFTPTGPLSLRIADNGAGFTLQPLRRLRTKGHHGIGNMTARAELAGGTLQIESAPGQGTQITLCIPLPAYTPRAEPAEPEYDSDGGGEPVLLSS